ncbi:MAG: hypothetical protein RLZZ141_1699 [Pseudomonadota bacterium]|jgi:HD-GYP domain-containing protein (c-di-GMP phosphodiesterase class II)
MSIQPNKSDPYRSLVKIGTELSSNRDLDSLLETILLSAKDLSNADGGTFYLVDDLEQLNYKMLFTTSLNLAMGGTSGNPVNFPPIPMNSQVAVTAWCAREQKSVNIQDVYEDTAFDFSGPRRFDAAQNYRTLSLLCIPLINHRAETVAVLQLINAKADDTGESIPFSTGIQELCEALASQAAVAISNHQLIVQLEELFESLISLINTAIDEKSPYTGGHCNRVPELALMLADSAAAAQFGPFSAFNPTKEEIYELRIASLLHDCGKVVTPVHVVDKATKLETITDRIKLVDVRFEVLSRDLEIAHLKGQISADQLAQSLAELKSDQAFLQKANVGGERMSSDDIDRVKRIGAREWQPQGQETQPFLTENELQNLTIVAGTLTGEERDIINYHIVATIKMLEALPWPKHLRNVPEFAGGHHERMDGKGYPKGLTKDQMSLQARMLGLADVFEALTAADRPYKSGKTLSEALKIMGFMKRDNHIDPDLFQIFIQDRIYLKYAEKFLNPEQIDEVDDEALLKI